MADEVLAAELDAEQAFVDRVYVQLERSARNARALAREGHGRGALGHEGGLVERDAMVFQAARRIAQLDAAHEGLVFGRLDLLATLDPEPRYIGRIGLRDDDRDSLLIDWRAPAAAVFYQATAAEPHDVIRRRVLRCQGPKVVGVEDELLDSEVDTDLPIVGEGALMAQLSRARDRSMHSIVATIQAEQDKAIRAPAKGVVAISGGPGTGKTVVALHRAAFLLYSDRRRYESGGVLVVGPSGVFMRYIERVLPSLGETAVALRSLGEVVSGLRATRHDAPAVARVKGSERMAELLRRTARQQAPSSPKEFRVFWRDDVIHLDRGVLGKLRRQLMGQGPRNRQLPRIASSLLDAMWRQVTGERGRERGREAFDDDILSSQAFLDFAVSWWPPLEAAEVLGWLGDPEFLARVGEGVVTPEEQRLLVGSWKGDSLSVEDVPLVDELRYAVGDVPDRSREEDHELDDYVGGDMQELTTAMEREYGPDSGPWRPPTHRIEDDGYAHVLVDEAQDLTPMQWRMVGRRGRAATWTIVGDATPASWPVAAEEDHELDDYVGGDMQELTTAMEREYGPDSGPWRPPTHRIEDDGYAHVLVDEAQDLTPMQWRMVGRRGRAATWTIVGDAAQSSWPVPAESAAARAAATDGKDLHEFHLSTNYRNSSEIYDYAAAYASRVGLDADLPTAVRATGVPPREVAAGPDLAVTVRAELTTIASEVRGTIGIVASIARRAEVAGWLASWPEFANDAPHATTPETAGDDRVVVLTGIDTKGLEFDGIVVVDPDAIEAESTTGRATLYVVLTRATQLLTLVR